MPNKRHIKRCWHHYRWRYLKGSKCKFHPRSTTHGKMNSLPFSQKHTGGLRPERWTSSRPHPVYHQNPLQYYPPYTPRSPKYLPLKISRPNFCMHDSSPSCMLHILPIPSSLIHHYVIFSALLFLHLSSVPVFLEHCSQTSSIWDLMFLRQ
jgi:hypothetical protein